MGTLKTLSILDLPLACTDYAGAIAWIKTHAIKPAVHAVEAANTQVAAMNRTDPAFRASMDCFDLIVPDGMPLVWAINQKLPADERLKDRVYGPTLMLETLKSTQHQPQYRHFLLGGKESTLNLLHKNFAQWFPDTILSGSYSPPFGEWSSDEFDRIHEKISSSGANLIWVGLGCPKQEHWIARHKNVLPHGVYFGIGAAFAFHAGEVSQAPGFFQRNGLEWAYRLAMEPRRLFKRYFTYNSLFIYHLLRDHVKAR